MDAKEFLLGYARMCSTNKECYYKCDLYKNRFCFKRSVSNESINFLSPEEMDKLIAIVEEWCAENPIKTRQSEFLKMFPNANCCHWGEEKGLDICPHELNTRYACNLDVHKEITECCSACKKDYWLAPINDLKDKETD